MFGSPTTADNVTLPAKCCRLTRASAAAGHRDAPSAIRENATHLQAASTPEARERRRQQLAIQSAERQLRSACVAQPSGAAFCVKLLSGGQRRSQLGLQHEPALDLLSAGAQGRHKPAATLLQTSAKRNTAEPRKMLTLPFHVSCQTLNHSCCLQCQGCQGGAQAGCHAAKGDVGQQG